MAEPQEAKTVEEQEARSKLGLSKIVYGLGMAARDSWTTFLTITAVLTPVIMFGQKYNIIRSLIKVPQRFNRMMHENVTDRFGEWSKSAGLAAGVAGLVSMVAHLPGFVRGPRKINAAEKIHEGVVEQNQLLEKENHELKIALAKAHGERLPFTETVQRATAETARTL